MTLDTASPLKAWPYPRWIAHRGAGTLAPENTLAAFRKGAEYGYRMFECDVKLSADGIPFLMHDATLERTTNGHGTGGDLPWAALSQLDAGNWHSRRYAGEPLPTLQNLARFCLANAYLLNIEIKPTPGTERQTGPVVAQQAAAWRGAWVADAGNARDFGQVLLCQPTCASGSFVVESVEPSDHVTTAIAMAARPCGAAAKLAPRTSRMTSMTGSASLLIFVKFRTKSGSCPRPSCVSWYKFDSALFSSCGALFP